MRIPNVVGGLIDSTDLKRVPVSDDEFARLRLKDGDLLFVRTNGNPAFVGRCAVFAAAELNASGHDTSEFVYASYLIRARISTDVVVPVYLREFLLGREGRRQLRALCKTSAGQYNINTDGLGKVLVPVPPPSVQRAFSDHVAYLKQVSASATASLTSLDALFSSLQDRAFRGGL